MTHYIIYFNQQWVGEHSDEWFRARGPLSNAVVEEIRAAGELVFAGGVDEDPRRAFTAVATNGAAAVTEGPYAPDEQRLGGLTIIDVADEGRARFWAGRMAEACGWPQETRRLF